MHLLRLFPVLLFAIASLSMLTYEQGILLRVEEVVQRWNSQVTYEYVGDGWVEFTDLEGETFMRQVGHSYEKTTNQPFKTITIDVRTIDTTGYGGMFRKMATLPIGSRYHRSFGFNGLSGSSYIIGHQLKDGQLNPTLVFSATEDKGFEQKYEFNQQYFVLPIAIGTVYGNNPPQFASDSVGTITIYDTPRNSDFPYQRSVSRNDTYATKEEPRLFDLDGDNLDELILASAKEGKTERTVVSEFSVLQGGFKDVFESDFNGNFLWGSWAVGDFDMDGKGEFATLTDKRFVIFVEYTGDKNDPYKENFTNVTRSGNGGFNHEGNDLDRDGRPEVFIGSDLFGGPMNIAVYETIGDNIYEDSVWIYIQGVGALSRYLTTGDVDGDRIDELIVTYGGMLLVLKATANDTYEPFWLKYFSAEIGVRAFDFNQDEREEVMVCQIEDGSGFTEIFTFNSITQVSTTLDTPNILILRPAYPHPVKNEVTISFVAPSAGRYTILLYDETGRYIATEGQFMSNAGAAAITSSANHLNAGIYFYRLTYKGQSITSKFVVMK